MTSINNNPEQLLDISQGFIQSTNQILNSKSQSETETFKKSNIDLKDRAHLKWQNVSYYVPADKEDIESIRNFKSIQLDDENETFSSLLPDKFQTEN